jgi:uracil-DNA glycosylase
MDGAVHDIWSEKGFSRQVNKATSLRNFLKMLLVAEKTLSPGNTGEKAVAEIVQVKQRADFPYINRLGELQQALLDQGFLLLNATLVFRRHVSPLKESKAWQPFLRVILDEIAARATMFNTLLPVLILWGKIAERLAKIESVSRFPQTRSEHPYNLSFIENRDMQNLFGSMSLLKRPKNK